MAAEALLRPQASRSVAIRALKIWDFIVLRVKFLGLIMQSL